ncbi:MAG: ADP-ribosylglycohydrolase family protein [Sulfurimonas sp.]|nr:ADP-ribosylglycohydrolase family protein [Sulfurimonas sp.]
MKNATNNSILATLTADAYTLGSHWVYDETELKNLKINWEGLNAPSVEWHGSKTKGDFTHYGDQTLFLLEYIIKNKKFDKKEYYAFWCDKMKDYKGYIDGATKNALETMDSSSSDLSICGRIAPLLLVSTNRDEFLKNVADFVQITHNTELASEVSQFFAQLLWDTKENQDIQKNIQNLKSKFPNLEKWIDESTATKNDDTISTLQKFGVSCDIDGGFACVIHLLSLDDSFKNIMIKNAKAGGDNSARAMIVAMIYGITQNTSLPKEWTSEIKEIDLINSYLK